MYRIRGAELAEPKSWNGFTASRGDPSAVPPNHLPAKAGLHCTKEVASVQLIAHNLLNHGVGCVSRLFLTCHFSGFSSLVGAPCKDLRRRLSWLTRSGQCPCSPPHLRVGGTPSKGLLRGTCSSSCGMEWKVTVCSADLERCLISS
jgi:hypothetical protein